jgi:hypothetical protein
MQIEQKLEALGLPLVDVDQQYRVNTSGAHFISYVAVNNLLYLSGTAPMISRASPPSSTHSAISTACSR